MRGEDYFRLGYYYYDKNDFENARRFFNLATGSFKEENPDHFYYAGAYYNIGITYWKEEDIDSAVWYWKRALKIEPDNEMYRIWYNKALQIKKADGM